MSRKTICNDTTCRISRMIHVALIFAAFAAHLRLEQQLPGSPGPVNGTSNGTFERSGKAVEQSVGPVPVNGTFEFFQDRRTVAVNGTLERLHDRRTVAVLLFGETFRSGGQHSRVTGLPESVRMQEDASTSQMQHLILPITQNGFRAYCFLATFNKKSRQMKMLMGWYEKCMPLTGDGSGLRCC